MLKCSACHNLYMLSSTRASESYRKAATCHNFYMSRSFRQHACSCCAYSYNPENASYRDAKRRRTIETRHEGPEGALLFLRAKTRVGKRRKQVPQRGTILAFLYVESGNLYKATQSQLSIDYNLPFLNCCIPFNFSLSNPSLLAAVSLPSHLSIHISDLNAPSFFCNDALP
jgi:hypothetical protein